MNDILSVQLCENLRKLNRYFEEEIKIGVMRRELRLKRCAASIFEDQATLTILAQQFVDSRDALYEKLAKSLEFTLQQFHSSRALRIATGPLEQNGCLIFDSAASAKRIPIVPVEFLSDLVIRNDHSATDNCHLIYSRALILPEPLL